MATEVIKNIDLDNPEFQDVWNLVQNTHQSVFLTGKAGTGKSTFLKYICANTHKVHVVLAPTGIAAVNVGGQTLHSFFKIPFKPLLPNDPEFTPSRIRKTLRYPKDKVQLIKKLDLIIIDEISMVRADIIDFIDKVLRIYSRNMREPFGGKQLLLVGDIFQLEPVVTRDMRDILQRYYKQFFFFNAAAFSRVALVPIELRKIYRQNDDSFISLLDRVRVNRASDNDMRYLNSRYSEKPDNANDFVITLATRRDVVDAINDEHMAALTTPEITYNGTIEGQFPENDLPTALNLTLKEGAQVIFIRNDKEGRWINGTIGKVYSLTENLVQVELEDGSHYVVAPEQWENMQYSYDEEKKAVVENVLGTFTQMPIKPAWALTVHKSQGLTFNHVIIDFTGGAFSSGQTYVALSRCTSLEGIRLTKPLSGRDIIVNRAVVEFSYEFNNRQKINDALMSEKINQLYRRAIHAFKHGEYNSFVDYYAQAAQLRSMIQSPVVQRYAKHLLHGLTKKDQEIKQLQAVIDAQNELLRNLAMEYAQMGDEAMKMQGSVVEEGRTPYGNQPLDDIALRSALANYNKALNLWQDCTAARLGKARLMLTIDEPDQAVAELKRVLETEPGNYEAHMLLGEIHLKMKDLPSAIKSYKSAIRARKTLPEPHEALAAIYEKIGLDDLADEQYEIAKRLRQIKKKTKKK
jgi:tetratricopeptide (TPR) repeat protein